MSTEMRMALESMVLQFLSARLTGSRLCISDAEQASEIVESTVMLATEAIRQLDEIAPKTLGDLIPDLALDKYGRWATGVTLAQLRALLWLVGEHSIREAMPSKFDDATHRMVLFCDEMMSGPRRKAESYNAMIDFYFKPFDLEEMRARMRKVARGEKVDD